MAEIPWKLIQKWADKEGKGHEIHPGNHVVGQFFIEHDHVDKIKDSFAELVEGSNFKLVGWREVPVNESVLGVLAK